MKLIRETLKISGERNLYVYCEVPEETGSEGEIDVQDEPKEPE